MLPKTWFRDGISDIKQGLKNYNIFRCDRSSSTSICLRFGGALIGIRSDIPSRLIKELHINIEHLFVSFVFNGSKFIIDGV